MPSKGQRRQVEPSVAAARLHELFLPITAFSCETELTADHPRVSRVSFPDLCLVTVLMCGADARLCPMCLSAGPDICNSFEHISTDRLSSHYRSYFLVCHLPGHLTTVLKVA